MAGIKFILKYLRMAEYPISIGVSLEDASDIAFSALVRTSEKNDTTVERNDSAETHHVPGGLKTVGHARD